MALVRRAHQRFLTDHVGEGRRPVFARKHAIGGGRRVSVIGSWGSYAHAELRHAGADGGRVGDRTATRMETRYGCFLPDLTGLARHTSAASLPAPISDLGEAQGCNGSNSQGHAESASSSHLATDNCLTGRRHASLRPCRRHQFLRHPDPRPGERATGAMPAGSPVCWPIPTPIAAGLARPESAARGRGADRSHALTGRRRSAAGRARAT